MSFFSSSSFIFHSHSFQVLGSISSLNIGTGSISIAERNCIIHSFCGNCSIIKLYASEVSSKISQETQKLSLFAH